MLSPNYPVLCFPLPYRVAPVFVQVVSPSLGWSPLSSFLVIWSPTGDTRGPSVVFEAVDMPCPGPFHFSYSVDYIYDFCPLPDPDVGLSVFVCDVEHTSFHFCLCGRKFVLCLFGQCPCLCTICHSWQHTILAHYSRFNKIATLGYIMAHEGMGTDHYSMSRLTMRRSPSSTGYCYILPVDEL